LVKLTNFNFTPKKIDVFLATYNRSNYIEEMVVSILNQSFKDFNLIILDNGSTDSTTQVINTFKDPRVFCLKEEVNSREFLNLPFSISKSEYFLIAHDDDSLEPNFLENQIKLLDQDKEINLLASKINLMDEKGKKLNKTRPRIRGTKTWGKHQFIETYFIKGDIIPCPSIIYRRTFVQDKQLSFEFKVGPAVDLFLLFKCNLFDGKIVLNNKGLYNYRLHQSQDSYINKFNLEYQVRPFILELLEQHKGLKRKYKKASLGFIFHIVLNEFFTKNIDYNQFKTQLIKLISLGIGINLYSIYWTIFGVVRGIKNKITV